MNQWHKIAIGLGSNLGDRMGYLKSASGRLVEDVLTHARFSTVYETEPWSPPAGSILPPYLNAVCIGQTEWKAPALLTYLKSLERDLGRQTRERYDSREIDLDR